MADSDVADLVDDDASDTYTAVLALIREMAPTEPIVRVDDYNPFADGVTNDDAAFAAAKAAATAKGGATILLGPHRYRINSVFTPGEGNSLRAPMSALETPNDKYCIVLGSGVAQVQLGGDVQGRGGNHGNFNIDANATGASPALRCTVNDQVVAPICVQNAPAIGYSIFASQNSKFVHPTADNCQDNIVVDGGSGGLTIENLHSTSPTRYGLRVYDSNPGGHAYGYQYGCADILFIKPLVEQYVNTATNLVRIQSGSRIKFEQPGLSVNTQSLTGAVVHIDNDDFAALGTVGTEVEFSSGNYHGGVTALEKIFYVKGTNVFTGNKLVVNGQSFFQQSEAIFSTDGATVAALDDEQWYVAPTVAAVFDAANPASSMFFWRKIQRTGMVFSLPDAAGAFSGHTPLAVRKSTDSTAGSRMYVTNDGTLGWCNGTNNIALLSATPDTTNGFLALTGLKLTGKRITSISLTQVSVAATALALDVSTIAPVHLISLTGVGTIASWTLTNPVDGQELELWITRASAQTFVWPANVTWENDSPPATTPTAGKYMRVFLKYSTSGAMWWEHKRRMLTAGNSEEPSINPATAVQTLGGIPNVIPETLTTFALGGDVTRYFPFVVKRPLTITSAKLNVQVAGTAGVQSRIGIYAATSLWQPGALIRDWGLIATDAGGVKTGTMPGTPDVLPPGRYLLCYKQSNVATNPTLRSIPYTCPEFANYDVVNNVYEQTFTRAEAFAALANPGSAWTAVTTSNTPTINCPITLQWTD